MKLEKKKKYCGTVRPGYSRRFQDLKFAPQHGHNVAQLLSLADPLSTSSNKLSGLLTYHLIQLNNLHTVATLYQSFLVFFLAAFGCDTLKPWLVSQVFRPSDSISL
jgi:hypothetical protein